MNLSRIESETGINYNDEEDFAIVYTANNSLKIKLDNLCKLYPKEFVLQHFAGDNDGIKSYHIPKRFVSIKTPRIISEKEMLRLKKQGKELAQRMSNKQAIIGKTYARINQN